MTKRARGFSFGSKNASEGYAVHGCLHTATAGRNTHATWAGNQYNFARKIDFFKRIGSFESLFHESSESEVFSHKYSHLESLDLLAFNGRLVVWMSSQDNR